MARIGRHKRVGPYKGGMGKASSYLRTTVSYDFDDKEIMPLLSKDKAFREAALSGKYTYMDGKIILKSPESAHLYGGIRPEIIGFYPPSAFYLGKAYNVKLRTQVVRKKAAYAQRNKVRAKVEAGAGGKVWHQEVIKTQVGNTHGGSSSGLGGVHLKPSLSKKYIGLQTPDKFHALGVVDQAVMLSYFETEDTTFNQEIEKYIEEKNMTNEKLAEKAGVSPRTIQRMRNEPGYRPTLKTIVAVCLSLHLFPKQSYKLISLAGYTFTSSPEEKVYCMLIDLLYTHEMEEINVFMLQFGIGNFEPKNK